MNKLHAGVFAAMLMVCGAAWGLEKYMVVRVTDRAGKDAYEVMSPEDYKNLQKQLQDEDKLRMKVLEEARKAWQADETTRKKSFPSAAIGRRKVQTLKEFTSEEDATEALGKYEDRDADKADRDKEREDARNKAQKKSKDMIDKEKKREADKVYYENAALNLYEAKLNELMAGGGAAAEGAEAKKP